MKSVFSKIWRYFADGVLAGITIVLGGAVFLACNNGSLLGSLIGACLFSVALLCTCIKGYSLYTGKIGYILSKHSKDDLAVTFIGLIGNIAATFLFGYIMALTFPNLKTVAENICANKLELELWKVLIRAILCGILIYLAVDIYRENKSTIGILICIPTFILSGYEHSIADMFYFAVAGLSGKALLFILIVIIGNSIGGIIVPLLKLQKKDKDISQNISCDK